MYLEGDENKRDEDLKPNMEVLEVDFFFQIKQITSLTVSISNKNNKNIKFAREMLTRDLP